MIASLTGTVTRILFDSVIIDVSGVGYRVVATPGTLANLTCGSTETLLTELVVREDDLTLYGFVDGNEQDLFILLQKTSGIGPKMALSILFLLLKIYVEHCHKRILHYFKKFPVLVKKSRNV